MARNDLDFGDDVTGIDPSWLDRPAPPVEAAAWPVPIFKDEDGLIDATEPVDKVEPEELEAYSSPEEPPVPEALVVVEPELLDFVDAPDALPVGSGPHEAYTPEPAPDLASDSWTPPSFVVEAPAETPGAPDAGTPSEARPAPAPSARADGQRRGRVIVVFGCRGGAGATTIAVNLAGRLAAEGKEACVVDVDFQLGDVFMALDMEPKISLSAMARDAAGLDGAALKRRLQQHESGLYALGQPGKLDQVAPDLHERLPGLLGALAQHFDAVIVDGVRDFGDLAMAALDSADEIVLVFTQDVAGVQRVHRVLELCRKLGYEERKLRPVLNRAARRSRLKIVEIERALGMPLLARLRNDYAATQRAQDSGELLCAGAPGAPITKDLARLSLKLLDEIAPPKRRGLLAFLLGAR